MLCSREELSTTLTKLARAFSRDTLTTGCRLEMAINIFRTALSDFESPDRERAITHFLNEVCEMPVPLPALPAPNARGSLALH